MSFFCKMRKYFKTMPTLSSLSFAGLHDRLAVVWLRQLCGGHCLFCQHVPSGGAVAFSGRTAPTLLRHTHRFKEGIAKPLTLTLTLTLTLILTQTHIYVHLSTHPPPHPHPIPLPTHAHTYTRTPTSPPFVLTSSLRSPLTPLILFGITINCATSTFASMRSCANGPGCQMTTSCLTR